MDKISIIVPIYNVSDYLNECLDSIINQTYKNLEIICINDGSTDNSLEIVKFYAQKDKRIIIVDKQNGGVSSARNCGIKIATGNFLTFVDPDDYLEQNAIEKLHETIIENDVDIVRGNFYKNINDRQRLANEKLNEFYNRVIDNKEIKEKIVIKIINGSIKCYVNLLLIKKYIVEKFHILFDEKIYIMEDIIFYLTLFMKIDKIYFLDIPLYHYRMNPNSLTNSPKYSVRNMYNMIDVNESITQILINNNIRNKMIYIMKDSAYCNAIVTNIYIIFKQQKKNRKIIYKYINTLLENKRFLNILENCQEKTLNLRSRIPIMLIKKKHYHTLYLFFYFRMMFSYINKYIKQ